MSAASNKAGQFMHCSQVVTTMRPSRGTQRRLRIGKSQKEPRRRSSSLIFPRTPFAPEHRCGCGALSLSLDDLICPRHAVPRLVCRKRGIPALFSGHRHRDYRNLSARPGEICQVPASTCIGFRFTRQHHWTCRSLASVFHRVERMVCRNVDIRVAIESGSTRK